MDYFSGLNLIDSQSTWRHPHVTWPDVGVIPSEEQEKKKTQKYLKTQEYK